MYTTADLATTIPRLALQHPYAGNATAVRLRPNDVAPTTSQIVVTPRAIDTGGDRVDTIALTAVVFVTAAPRDRDRLDVTPGDILSCRHADLPTPMANMTKTTLRVSVLGIGRGGTTMQCDRHLLEVG